MSMPAKTNIEWTDTTWNPVTGCSKVSSGCRYCYAERMAKRLKAMGQERYINGFEVSLHNDLLSRPLEWKKPKMVFVNSMSDLFHEEVPFEFIQKVFKTMERCPHHIFQVLTKRSRRLRRMAPGLPWPENVWMGVSIENESTLNRLDDLKQVPAFIRFISCEPLLGPLDELSLDRIHWVIVGGESGPGARILRPEWAESIMYQCRRQGVEFFFNQWGGVRKKQNGRVLNGRIYDGLPKFSYPVLVEVW